MYHAGDLVPQNKSKTKMFCMEGGRPPRSNKKTGGGKRGYLTGEAFAEEINLFRGRDMSRPYPLCTLRVFRGPPAGMISAGIILPAGTIYRALTCRIARSAYIDDSCPYGMLRNRRCGVLRLAPRRGCYAKVAVRAKRNKQSHFGENP